MDSKRESEERVFFYIDQIDSFTEEQVRFLMELPDRMASETYEACLELKMRIDSWKSRLRLTRVKPAPTVDTEAHPCPKPPKTICLTP